MKSRTVLLILVITAVIVLFGVGVVYGSLFKLTEINVVSDSLTEEEISAVKGLSGLKLNQNLFKIDENKVAANINASGDYVADSVTVLYPSKVDISVSKRIPAALIEYDNGYIVIDSGANVIKTVLSSSAYDVPIFTGIRISQYLRGDKLLTKDSYQRSLIIAMLDALSSADSADIISIISLEDLSSVYLVSANGKRIDLCEAVNISEKISLLKEDKLREKILDGNDYTITLYDNGYFTVS